MANISFTIKYTEGKPLKVKTQSVRDRKKLVTDEFTVDLPKKDGQDMVKLDTKQENDSTNH